MNAKPDQAETGGSLILWFDIIREARRGRTTLVRVLFISIGSFKCLHLLFGHFDYVRALVVERWRDYEPTQLFKRLVMADNSTLPLAQIMRC